MKFGTLVLATALAAGAVLRRRHLTTPVKILAVLGVAALAASGFGLVELPSAEQIVRTSTGALGALTYVVVGAFALVETGAFVGLVAPGEIVVVLGGVSAGHGTISLPVLIAVVWACALTGDLISYALGRRFGRSLLLAHGAGLGVTEARVSQLERVLAEHTAKTLVLGRYVGIVRPLLPFLAGATHIPARRFVPITVCAAGLWSATFCGLGAAFWSSLDELVSLVERGSLGLGAIAVAAALAVIAWRRLRGPRQDTITMTTSTATLGTRLRTWALVAGLTGLLIACGALIGGSVLWIFVIAAVAMNAFGYLFSDRIALRIARARPLAPYEAPELYAIARELASLAEVPVPSLHLIPGAQANAFATGRNPAHAAIAVTEGLLRTLPTDQVRAVLAHEFGHIRNHDILVSSVAAMVAGAISAVASILQLSFLFGSSDEEGENPIAAFALMLIAPIGATLLQLAVSRQREYLADATAARMLGTGRPLAEALQTITADERAALEVNPATAPMYVVNPLRAQGIAGLFATHPPVRERIARLLSYKTRGPVRRPRTPVAA